MWLSTLLDNHCVSPQLPTKMPRKINRPTPIGDDSANWILTDYRLRDDALAIVDEWLSWHVSGVLIEDGVLDFARREFASLGPTGEGR